MIVNYAHELEKQYMPYAILGDDEIIGFMENTPISAKKAAKEHILMCRKFDDITNYEYYDNIIKKLGLEDIKVR